MGNLAIEAGKEGIDAAGSLVGTGLGMATAAWEDRRQVRQQKKLQDVQIAGQKEMGQYNQGLALDMWEKTNYEAQRKQLEKAGLNPGLMYSQGGPGGTTATPTGSTGAASAAGSKGEVGMGLQMAMQMQMQKAQIELTKAETKKTETEANKLAGVDTTEAQTRIGNLLQATKNAKIQEEIANYDKKLKEIETNIASMTASEVIKGIELANDKLEAEAKVAGETAGDLIAQIKGNTLEQGLRIAAAKQGLIKQGADIQQVQETIKKIKAETWNEMFAQTNKNKEQLQRDQEIAIKKTLSILETQKTLFNTSTPQEIKQWTEIITGFIPLIGRR